MSGDIRIIAFFCVLVLIVLGVALYAVATHRADLSIRDLDKKSFNNAALFGLLMIVFGAILVGLYTLLFVIDTGIINMIKIKEISKLEKEVLLIISTIEVGYSFLIAIALGIVIFSVIGWAKYIFTGHQDTISVSLLTEHILDIQCHKIFKYLESNRGKVYSIKFLYNESIIKAPEVSILISTLIIKRFLGNGEHFGSEKIVELIKFFRPTREQFIKHLIDGKLKNKLEFFLDKDSDEAGRFLLTNIKDIYDSLVDEIYVCYRENNYKRHFNYKSFINKITMLWKH